jgi:hypothetical protein
MSIDLTKRRELEMQLLEVYKAELSTLEQKINLLEQSLGLDDNVQSSAPAQTAPSLNGSQSTLSGMSREQAAIQILKKENRRIPTRELGELLEQHGLDMSSKHSLVSLNTALSRSSNIRKVKTVNGIAWELNGSHSDERKSVSRKNRGRRGSMITLGNVTEEAIRKAGHPLHVTEIRKALAVYGINPSRGTLSSGLMRDSKGRFKNIGGATYTLAKEELRPA